MNKQLFGVIALLFVATGATARETEAQKYFAAADRFETLKAEALKKGEAPRLSDPRVADTLATLSDKSGKFGTASFPMTNELRKQNLCSISQKVHTSYSTIGREAFVEEKIQQKKISDNSTDAEIQSVMGELFSRNIMAYQDEVYPILAFQLKCRAAELPLLAQGLEKMSAAEIDGMHNIIEGMRQVFPSSIINWVAGLNLSEVHEANKLLTLKASLHALPAISALLKPDGRARFKAVIEQLLPNTPKAYQADVVAMSKILTDAKCEGLCKY